ncbi:COG1361 S-layer family protein [Methanotorris igneus]|uniref:CARDB domain-containing protein n=1 Tax=Methanotorris igneus (strain DSM 5666 / JCM 11834 / Kol 5) TaxID=880724 RepID=F6BB08_METIK|nr:COG1361 S-layer family protein [Methanotorris igneus]AEF97095.1 hypothetical protein Metig_1561 [Methanotorris igneus Kol 5]
MLKKIFFILMIAIFVANTYALTIDNPQYRVDRSTPTDKYPNVIHPGDDVDVWFKITNDYDYNLKDITVTIKPYYPFEIKQVNPTKGVAKISHLNSGESDIVHFRLHVDENACSQDYKICVNVVATEYDKKEIINKINISKIYYLPVYGVANFEVFLDNYSITQSKLKDIKIIIKNMGTGIAKDTSVRLVGNENVDVVGPTQFYLGTIYPKGSVGIFTKIYAKNDIKDGVYPIYVSIFWIGEDGVLYNTTIPINIRVTIKPYNNSIFIYLDGCKYVDGKYEIDIGVANRGSIPLRHCVLTIKGLKLDRNVNYIGDLDEDDYEVVSFTTDKAINKTTEITTLLSYFDDYHNEYKVIKKLVVYPKKVEKSNNLLVYYIFGVIVVLILLYMVLKKIRKKEEFGA